MYILLWYLCGQKDYFCECISRSSANMQNILSFLAHYKGKAAYNISVDSRRATCVRRPSASTSEIFANRTAWEFIYIVVGGICSRPRMVRGDCVSEANGIFKWIVELPKNSF